MSPTSPTAAPSPAVIDARSGPTGTGSGSSALPSGATTTARNPALPAEAPLSGSSAIAFPPRNEPFDFRIQLEAKYRDGLRRNPVSSYVDIEGTVVWTQEYLRYRLNGCPHQDAVARVFRQVDGFGVQPVCGAETAGFPPRNDPFDFRIQLEGKYRDGLRRNPTTTYVDAEGDIVWTQEYLRYRVSTCDHFTAVNRVFAQIDGRGVQQDCRPSRQGGVLSGVIRPLELIYADWRVTTPGALAWVLIWLDPSVDLDMALTTTECNDPTLMECELLDLSVESTGNREVVSRVVQPGEVYRTFVVNWDGSRSQPFLIETEGAGTVVGAGDAWLSRLPATAILQGPARSSAASAGGRWKPR